MKFKRAMAGLGILAAIGAGAAVSATTGAVTASGAVVAVCPNTHFLDGQCG